jgi:hypothetical protein
VLLVGVFGHGEEHRIISRLTTLGGVPCRLETPPSWDVADPSIVVLTGEATSNSVHLTVADRESAPAQLQAARRSTDSDG